MYIVSYRYSAAGIQELSPKYTVIKSVRLKTKHDTNQSRYNTLNFRLAI